MVNPMERIAQLVVQKVEHAVFHRHAFLQHGPHLLAGAASGVADGDHADGAEGQRLADQRVIDHDLGSRQQFRSPQGW